MSVIHIFPCIQLTDLSSLSSEEGTSPSHRKFSSTSYIMKKKRRTTASKTSKQASLSSRSSSNQQENKDGECGSAEKKRQHTDIKLLHELSQSEIQNTASSLDTGARGGQDGSIPSICITSQYALQTYIIMLHVHSYSISLNQSLSLSLSQSLNVMIGMELEGEEAVP